MRIQTTRPSATSKEPVWRLTTVTVIEKVNCKLRGTELVVDVRMSKSTHEVLMTTGKVDTTKNKKIH